MKLNLNDRLARLNLYLGTLIVLFGFYEFYLGPKNRTPLYISLAIIIVGPVEDLLYKLIDDLSIPETKQSFYYQMVDQITSLAFLILLGAVVLESS